MNKLDRLMILYTLFDILEYTLQQGTVAAALNRIGASFGSIGVYFLVRLVVKKEEDMRSAFAGLALILVPLALFMAIEQVSGFNVFSVFGGVPQITALRQGRLRSQGPFEHPILAGTFGATLVPVFIGLWRSDSAKRWLAAVGIAAGTVMAVTCASSGPVLAYVAGIAAVLLYKYRGQMRKIVAGFIVALLLMQLMMKAPIWALFMRISVVGGSDGYQRFFLLDQFLRRVPEWWLFGVSSTAHWGEGLFDVTNQFVVEGVRGGIITLFLFISVIAVSYKMVGRTVQRLTEPSGRMVWVLGAALFSHCVAFMGVSYFDQTVVGWYLLLGTIGSLGIAYSGASVITIGGSSASRSRRECVGQRESRPQLSS